MRRLWQLGALGVALLAWGCADQPAPLEVTFIANAGFLVATPQHAVLVDAVFGFTEGEQLEWTPLKETLEAIEQAQPPFDRVATVLVTHSHMDHFDSISCGRLLESSPETVLAGPPDVIDEMKTMVPETDALEERLQVLEASWGSAAENRSLGGVQVRALALHHGSDRFHDLEHLAYVVEMDGRRVLHLGDALPELSNFAPFQWLTEESFDVAFVPFWFLEDEGAVEVLRAVLKARHIVLMHMDPAETESWQRKAAAIEGLPPIVIFEHKMEHRLFE